MIEQDDREQEIGKEIETCVPEHTIAVLVGLTLLNVCIMLLWLLPR